MINLDQVRTLEWKVKQAVQLIVHLRRENDTLRGRLSDTEVRLQDLETLLESFKSTQNEMESGIRSALEELDNLEAGTAVQEAGPVDALSYPPAVEEVPQASAAEPSFEEEYAALAAAEAEAQGDPVPVPESVELEDVSAPEDIGDETMLLDSAGEAEPESEPEPEPEPEPAVPEEKQPEQPGLGIF